MLAESILTRLSARGVDLWVEAGILRFRAPRNAIDEDSRQEIAQNRDAIIAVLSQRGQKPVPQPKFTRIQPRAPGQAPLLSFAQKRLWFLDQLDPGSPRYNIGSLLRIREPIDLDMLAMAVDDLFVRHEVFRSRIRAIDGEPILEILPRPLISLEVIDLSSNPVGDIEVAVKDIGRDALRTRFDLAEGRLALMRAVRFATSEYAVVFVVHHIAADGWSLDIVLRDLRELYEARLMSRPSRLAPLQLQYSDFAAWEQEKVRAGNFNDDVAFWRDNLSGAPPVHELPTDRPRRSTGSTRGSRYIGHIEAAITDRLRDIAREQSATLFMALIAVWQTLLSRLSGQEDVVIGSPIAARDDDALNDVVGCFINNIALRGDLSGSPSFTQLLDRTRHVTLEAFRHGALPFDMVVEAINPPRTASYAPIFQTLFTLMNFQAGASPESGTSYSAAIDADTGTSRFDLSLELSRVSAGEHAGDLLAAYEYDADLFDEATIDRMHAQFLRLLRAACDDPAIALANVSLLSREEEHRIAVEWNATNREFDRARLVHHQIAETARRIPHAVAVSAESEALDYAGFEARSNAIARVLAGRGVAPGSRVGVCLARGVNLPIVLAAILKAGAAYVPLDPAHPAERIQLVLDDADVACIVTTSDLMAQFTSQAFLLMDEDATSIEEADTTPLDVSVRPGDTAYLMYTSGSTGKPKGVEVSHGNLASFLEAMRLEISPVSGERLLAVTTPAFDIAGLELWLPLTVGGETVLASEIDIVDGEALADLIETHDIRLLQATPTTWRLLLEAGWQGKADLKALCGGEALPLDLAQALLGKVGALWNVYGPTETTIWSTVHRVLPADLAGGRIPIGKPIANTRVYVLEPSGVIAPIGAPGELLIAGEGVARGYRNLPALSAEKFVEATILDRRERVYRTGDLAQWRADGTLNFSGRRDGQVKVRGFRIELGEIEVALSSHPSVRQAYVSVSTGGAGQTLVAYLVYESGQEPTTSELRRYVRTRLPDYMVPALFVTIESVPLSPSGKVDRRRLPDPFRAGKRAHRQDEPLADGPERMLAEIWCDILGTSEVGPGDNFFELGGHSLLSLRVAAAVEHRTGWRMDPRALFFQTLREVAAGIAQREAGLVQ